MPEVYSGFFVISARIRTKGILLIPWKHNFHSAWKYEVIYSLDICLYSSKISFFFLNEKNCVWLFLKNILQWNTIKDSVQDNESEIFVIKSRNFYSRSILSIEVIDWGLTCLSHSKKKCFYSTIWYYRKELCNFQQFCKIYDKVSDEHLKNDIKKKERQILNTRNMCTYDAQH